MPNKLAYTPTRLRNAQNFSPAPIVCITKCSKYESLLEQLQRMFKKEYQGGSHVEVLSAQGRDPMSHCKVTGTVIRRYDKGIRGYLHSMEGDSTTTRIQFPANDRSSLSLVQPYLILQVAIPKEARFTLELSLQDSRGGRRRLLLSSSVREPSVSPLVARVPFVTMATGQWVNVCLDLPSLVTELFPGHTHKSLESLIVGGTCQLRRVFTMSERPISDVVSETRARDIPKACQMFIDHSPIPTQVMSSVMNDSQHQPTSKPVAAATAKVVPRQQPPPTHVAFGQKVAIPDHILSRQAKSQSAGNTRRKGVKSSDGTSSVRQQSAPSSGRQRGVATLKGVGLDGQTRPHHSEIGDWGDRSSKDGVRERGKERGRERGERSEGQVEKERQKGESGKGGHSKTGRETRQLWLETDELLALDVLGVKKLPPPSGEESGKNGDFREDIVDSVPCDMEPRQKTSTPEPLEQRSEENSYLDYSVEGEGEGEGERDGNKLFSYFSPPRSAGSRHTPSAGSRRSTRGVELDTDFLSTANEQGYPHSSEESGEEECSYTSSDNAIEREEPDTNERGLPRDNTDKGLSHDVTDESTAIPLATNRNEESHPLTQTRLSDDYDWRQYASPEDDPLLHSDTLLNTHPSHPPILTGHHGNSTSNELDTSTLSESMTLDGQKPAATQSLLDSLDTRDMGGALSPAATHHPPPQLDKSLHDDELELMYDPQLKCFYDPKTHKYYELVQ